MATETGAPAGGGLLNKLLGAAKQSGPGYLLSAYTLGSGSALGSLWAGSKYGYELLWVQPVSMIMGVLVLTGAAHFALRNEERPYLLLYRLSPFLALSWAFGSLFASVIWHFPQYGLAYDSIRNLLGLAEPTGLSQFIVGALVLGVSLALTWSYASGTKGLKLYEAAIKLLVWLIVICLLIVVIRVDIDWGAALRGFVGFRIPADPDGHTLFLGMLSAAVGINMTFLFPYSLRSQEWQEDGTKKAMGDLIKGMLLPYVVSVSLLVLASAATVHASGIEVARNDIAAFRHVFEQTFGGSVGPTLFYLGLLGMPLSSITLHMLTCGFIVSEMFGQPLYGRHWKIGSLLPAIGVLGVATKLPAWLPVSASALTLIFLPIAYLGFTLLFKQQYEADPPEVKAQVKWLLAPMVIVTVIIAGLALQKVFSSPLAMGGTAIGLVVVVILAAVLPKPEQ